MMRTSISLVLMCMVSLLLVGCIVSAPAPQEQPDELVGTLIDNDESNEEEEADEPYVPEEEPVNTWTQDDTKNSSWEGVFEWTVRIEQRTELDPWAFAGDENAEAKRTGCEQQIARNEITADCPTNTVLYAVALNAEGLPKEIVTSEYAPVDSNPSEIVVGCVGAEGWYAAPLWELKSNLNGVVSINDQEKLLAAADAEAEVPVRITKRAYAIPWRGGSSCDIAFTRLQIVTE